MRQPEPGRMQEHAPRAPGRARPPVEGKIAVLRVTDDRMSDRRQMAPDLVGAASLDRQLEEGSLGAARDLRPVSDGFLEVHAALLLAGLGLLVLGEAQVHRAAVALESALRQRQIRLLRFARREYLGESDHRLPRLAHYHHAAGFPVEPVGGAGLDLAFRYHQPLPPGLGPRLID